MNEGLFEKYSKVLKEKCKEKEEVITLLKEVIGIIFKEEELVIQKKTISFQISSVKKNILIQKNIKNKLKEKGYNIKI